MTLGHNEKFSMTLYPNAIKRKVINFGHVQNKTKILKRKGSLLQYTNNSLKIKKFKNLTEK